MHKSIYSLVLADEVVAAVDQMAYRLHTSRSNLINQILAEHLSCVTPEMRMQAVFSRMESLADTFRIQEQTSAHMLSLQSRLDYKYKVVKKGTARRAKLYNERTFCSHKAVRKLVKK